MTRHIQLRFATLFIMVTAAVALMAASSRALAQDCLCEFYMVRVDPGVMCKVTVCVLSPDGTECCVVIAPGGSAPIKCVPGGTIGFLECGTTFIPFTPAPECHIGIGAGPNCCTIDACLDNSTDCPSIYIRPSIVDSCPCP